MFGFMVCSILGMVLLLGCSRGRSGIEIVRVEGRITFDGGPMPAAGTLRFLPRSQAANGSGSRPTRPGSAQFETDGRFRVTSWEPGDGLVPGTYAVSVECWQTPPTMDGPPAVSHVPSTHLAAATTPLEIVVPIGEKVVQVDLNIERASE